MTEYLDIMVPAFGDTIPCSTCGKDTPFYAYYNFDTDGWPTEQVCMVCDHPNS